MSWGLRTRLTVVYTLLFLLAGSAVVGVTYVLVREVLESQHVPVIVDGELVLKPAGEPPFEAKAGLLGDFDQQRLAEKRAMEELANREYRDLVLGNLLRISAWTLLGVALLTAVSAWFLTGLLLRSLAAITATARRVADRTLYERVSLRGPRDEIRELADTFDEMLDRLDRAFDGQKRFVANASHELRTPLAINRTLIEVAMADRVAPPEVRRLGQVLLGVNERHERLIDGLLLLARSDQPSPDPEPVDLAELVDAVLDRQASAGLTVRRDLEPAPVLGDPVLLERLVANLVDNACRYNVPGGLVEVTVRPGASLTVANSGPEVAAHEVPTLFEPFRRLTDRVGSADGSGLGLSIVRSVAGSHGGGADAEPRTGGGLTVRVQLPAGVN